MAETIRVRRDGEIAEVLLNRPGVLNAFDLDMLVSFASHLNTLSIDDGVRGVVISGEGRAFCAGGDLNSASGFPDGVVAGFNRFAEAFNRAALEIRRMRKPVIAAIDGAAIGGGLSLALACDFRVMARSAVMRQAYTSNGISMDGGGTFTLPRLVGMARAMEIVAFDRPISSEQALAWGLATVVVDDGRALEEAMNMAHDLARNSLSAFGWTKQLLTDSFNTLLEAHLESERVAVCSCVAHPDGEEGLRAFAEKRKPVFYRE